MIASIFRWLKKNLGTLLLSLVLAIVVWVSAVTSSDPNVERFLTRSVEIKLTGKAPELKLMKSSNATVRLKLKAPQSLWERLDSDPSLVSAWVDLSNLGSGDYSLPVQVKIDLSPVRLVSQEPQEISLTLEPVLSERRPITLLVTGKPPLGYQATDPQLSVTEVLLSGPASLVAQVAQIQARLDIEGMTDTLTQQITLQPLDAADQRIEGLTISPNQVTISQPISLLGGYRNVIVRVVTQGNVANGYRLTNYYASPSSIIVFSSDPSLVDALPGYVETVPLDLTNSIDDFEALLELDLPAGISVVGDSRVLVQVSIAAIESSLTISLPIEVTNLAPGLQAEISPSTVDVILSGPVPVLNDLRPEDIRVKVNLEGFEVGTYQIIPVIDFLPAQIQKISILPATVEVTILLAPTPTPTVAATPGIP
ncbi:MAG: CdaR family protein [Anaerolineales bacterium]|nr:CdaR family protein [Anaerolineales bacterium]